MEESKRAGATRQTVRFTSHAKARMTGDLTKPLAAKAMRNHKLLRCSAMPRLPDARSISESRVRRALAKADTTEARDGAVKYRDGDVAVVAKQERDPASLTVITVCHNYRQAPAAAYAYAPVKADALRREIYHAARAFGTDDFEFQETTAKLSKNVRKQIDKQRSLARGGARDTRHALQLGLPQKKPKVRKQKKRNRPPPAARTHCRLCSNLPDLPFRIELADTLLRVSQWHY